jgi:hypothetical protein
VIRLELTDGQAEAVVMALDEFADGLGMVDADLMADIEGALAAVMDAQKKGGQA